MNHMTTTLLVLCITFAALTTAIQVELPVLGTKCIGDDLSKGQIISGVYETETSQLTQVRLEITDPAGVVIHTDTDVRSGSFAFTVEFDGEHAFCFTENKRQTASVGRLEAKRVLIEIDDHNFNPEDKNKIDKESLKPLQYILQKSERVLNNVKSELRSVRRFEEEHRNTGESINARVSYLSMFTMIVVVASGVWQGYYLRNFFRKSKVI